MKRMVVDPPSGWRYGFPKVVEDERPTKEWFLANGYPQSLIDQGMLGYIRLWFEEEEDNKN